jgi:hypothetical protein
MQFSMAEPARPPDNLDTARPPDAEKRAARQGGAGQGAGQGPSVRLSCRAGQGQGRAGRAGAK